MHPREELQEPNVRLVRVIWPCLRHTTTLNGPLSLVLNYVIERYNLRDLPLGGMTANLDLSLMSDMFTVLVMSELYTTRNNKYVCGTQGVRTL